jgi:hypothetical protein
MMKTYSLALGLVLCAGQALADEPRLSFGLGAAQVDRGSRSILSHNSSGSSVGADVETHDGRAKGYHFDLHTQGVMIGGHNVDFGLGFLRANDTQTASCSSVYPGICAVKNLGDFRVSSDDTLDSDRGGDARATTALDHQSIDLSAEFKSAGASAAHSGTFDDYASGHIFGLRLGQTRQDVNASGAVFTTGNSERATFDSIEDFKSNFAGLYVGYSAAQRLSGGAIVGFSGKIGAAFKATTFDGSFTASSASVGTYNFSQSLSLSDERITGQGSLRLFATQDLGAGQIEFFAQADFDAGHARLLNNADDTADLRGGQVGSQLDFVMGRTFSAGLTYRIRF